MAGPSRYNVGGKQAGLVHGILKNNLGIKDQKALDDAETLLLHDTYAHFFDLLECANLKFDLALVFDIHKFFLGTLYSWAGQVRTIDISKGGMLFASVKYIDDALKDFKKILRENLPTDKDSKRDLARKLAIIHNEFNAIHPFREGNGRTIRLFLDLMAVKAGYNPVDWIAKTQKEYFAACAKGMSQEHTFMEKIILNGLTKK